MKRGFSLIELLVVVAIITVLIGVATPYYSDYVRESRITKAKQDLSVLKQAVVLYNSQEDMPYQGNIATTSPYVSILGENDFNGLQGRYLTYIPVDPWGKNYKLDPYACFVYSEGVDSRDENDNIREYYIKDLALIRIEWEDLNNNRKMDTDDLLYFYFNKSVWAPGGLQASDFDVYENNEIVDVASASLDFTDITSTYFSGYDEKNASNTVLIAEIGTGTVKLGVHSLALKDELNVLQNYREVRADRSESTATKVVTSTEMRLGKPLRYAVRTSPIKITPK